MKYFNLFIVCFALLALNSCGKINDSTNEEIKQSNFSMKIGDNRIYSGTIKFNFENDSLFIFQLAQYTAIKDTLINNRVGQIISLIIWDYASNDPIRYDKKYVLTYETDSVLAVYEFKSNNQPVSTFPFTLAKQTYYDTTVFSDRYTSFVLPLTSGFSWKYRNSGDPNSNDSQTIKFLGYDTLQFEGKPVPCKKTVVNVLSKIYQWHSEFGLLKAQIEFNEQFVESTDSGTVITDFFVEENYQLLAINVSNSVIDSLKNITKIKNSAF